uniref:Immunoglobulin domain-containing protein n=1 Tax=Cyprinus carpio TaxID=7962 RepID=A0A8C1PFF8_CYPCA
MFHKFVLFCLCCWSLTGVFGDSVSVMEGDSVTLHTDLTEIHAEDDILWRFGAEKSLIAKMKKKKQIPSTFNGPDRRFRDRLKLDDQTGSLNITNITTEHTGVYEVKIIGVKESSKTFSVSVYARLPVPVISSNSSRCSSSSSSSSSYLMTLSILLTHKKNKQTKKKQILHFLICINTENAKTKQNRNVYF